MSMPTFTAPYPPITLEQAINMILESIAKEELSLSHILDAEGEKIQYVIGRLHKECARGEHVKDVLAVNKSVKGVIDSVTQNQMLLKSKMEYAIDALEKNKGPEGPTGPTGPTGPPGPPGPPCKCHSRCSAGFEGYRGQRWKELKTIKWERPNSCCSCRSISLSNDGTSVLLCGDRCYSVNFTVSLCTPESGNVRVAVRTRDSRKPEDKFVCCAYSCGGCEPVTVSGAGILIPAGGRYQTELSLVLQSPCEAKVKQASISIFDM